MCDDISIIGAQKVIMYNFYTYISRNTVDHAVLTIVLVHLHINNSFCIGTWLECPLWRAKQAMTAHDNLAGIIKGDHLMEDMFFMLRVFHYINF